MKKDEMCKLTQNMGEPCPRKETCKRYLQKPVDEFQVWIAPLGGPECSDYVEEIR